MTGELDIPNILRNRNDPDLVHGLVLFLGEGLTPKMTEDLGSEDIQKKNEEDDLCKYVDFLFTIWIG